MSEPVRLIGSVESIDGVKVDIGVDYSAVTITPGGRFDDEQFTKLMGYLQEAYEDDQREMYAETENDIGQAIHDDNPPQGMDPNTGRAPQDDWLN